MAGLYIKDKGGDHGQLGRRPEDPAGRPLHRRLPGGRQGGQPGRSRRSTATRRTSSTRRSARRSRSTRSQQGSKVVFQVAGQCGLGALDAAKEKGVQGIGVDADQAYLGDHIMTSAHEEGRRGGVRHRSRPPRTARSRAATNTIFDLKSDGVGIGKTNAEGAEVRRPGQGGRRTRSPPARSPTSRTRSSKQDSADARRRARARAARDHQAVRHAGRERRGGLRAAAWGDPRAARGERRGQVDPDERPLRAPPARRGRDPARRGAGRRSTPRGGRSGSASAWSTSTSCSCR